jgi:hypothetical protein
MNIEYFNVPEIIYHYTSYEKFKCIVENGTLRFSLSTQSNDFMDTECLTDLLKNGKVITDKDDVLLHYLNGYFKDSKYKNRYKSYVSCFSQKPDSRLFWDAYTVNRPPLKKCQHGEEMYCYSKPKYNGVCIGINRSALTEVLKNCEHLGICQSALLSTVYYSEDEHMRALKYLAEKARNHFEEIKKEIDQEQNLIPAISYRLGGKNYCIKPKKCFVEAMHMYIDEIETFSTFFKNLFWHEEEECRASLSMLRTVAKSNPYIKYNGTNEYIDLDINADCIDHIILGPEFTELEEMELRKAKDNKIDFNLLDLKKSSGTNVIRMK